MDYLQYRKIYGYNVGDMKEVLNLIINGLPSILSPQAIMSTINGGMVLNLIINGLPSILEQFLFEPVGLIKF